MADHQSAKRDMNWAIVHTVTSGNTLIEISASDGYQKRYSYRITWVNDVRRGPWFPDSGVSFADGIMECVSLAETWILDKREIELKDREGKLAQAREIETAKRKRHDENVEKRRVENRAHANRPRKG